MWHVVPADAVATPAAQVAAVSKRARQRAPARPAAGLQPVVHTEPAGINWGAATDALLRSRPKPKRRRQHSSGNLGAPGIDPTDITGVETHGGLGLLAMTGAGGGRAVFAPAFAESEHTARAQARIDAARSGVFRLNLAGDELHVSFASTLLGVGAATRAVNTGAAACFTDTVKLWTRPHCIVALACAVTSAAEQGRPASDFLSEAGASRVR
jgi:hypothetical protein